jgi:hypothetical protein
MDSLPSVRFARRIAGKQLSVKQVKAEYDKMKGTA